MNQETADVIRDVAYFLSWPLLGVSFLVFLMTLDYREIARQKRETYLMVAIYILVFALFLRQI